VDVVQLLSQFAWIVIDTNIACVYFCLYMLHTVLFIAVYCERKNTKRSTEESQQPTYLSLSLSRTQ